MAITCKTFRLAAQVLLLLPMIHVVSSAADVPPLDCVIEPHMIVDLSSQIDGIVDTMQVDRGDLVQSGQALVILESSVEEAVVQAARARAEASAQLRSGEVSAGFAQRRKDRVESLYKERAVSPDQMDETETQKTLSSLQLDQARENRHIAELQLRQAIATLNRHTIKSPIDGVVVQRFLSPGESVKDKPILRLAQIDPLRVEVIVPVSRFGEVRVGQTAVVHPEPPKTGEYQATVAVVDRVADAASGTFRVRLSLPNPDHDLPSGLKCQVQISSIVDEESTRTMAATSVVSQSASPGPGRRKVQGPRPDVLAVGARSCRTVGPINNAPQARQILTAVQVSAERAELREKRTADASGYLILSSGQQTLDAALELAVEMQAAGIDDVFVLRRGRHKHHVSLGHYTNESFARQRVGEVEAAGFTARLVPRNAKSAEFWIDLVVANNADAMKNLAQTLAPLSPAISTVPMPCEKVVAEAK